ncbi:YlxR family protein [Streptomonospora wellingtoniae]|uniref:YlxR family protein n=1 Tax=Streptomonospora wellingtoniae TaxID=3075544 RepID=A0ABU2KQC2_9ACTN|nr:YlxR family protein [Streptomonospora sp. DSM 45055]MDT0301458.1 YlxR family protein [Streptomonospora sp. DSM 45055]
MRRRARLGSRGRSRPVRTCVGCRSRAAQSDLMRLVASSGAAVPDPPRRMPGRGAYLHADPGCWESAKRRGGLARALRSARGLDTSRVDALFAAGPRVGDAPGSG